MFLKFQEHLQSHFSIQDRNLLLAFSGGIDSCVLLDLCLKAGLKPALAHCNFQLRGQESHDDAEWARALAVNKKLTFHLQNFETQEHVDRYKVSTLMAARDLRYEWFAKLADQHRYEYILVAHHADDVLETFMIHVARGTGLRGLVGIPERRGKILRPLLPFGRSEILQYAQENAIEWREDSSNAKTDYLRNALRHRVIPLWKKTDPNFEAQFSDTLSHLGWAQKALDAVVEGFKAEHFFPTAAGVIIPVKALEKLLPLEYYLYELFSPFGFKNVSDLKQLMHSQSGKQLFSDQYRLVKNRADFLLTAESNNTNQIFNIVADDTLIQDPIQLFFSDENTFKKCDSKSVLLDKKKLKFPMTLRKWKQSDYFYPYGMQGKKKLSKYFKDEKYSLLDKEAQWLLCSGEEIVWIIGKRADRRFLAHEKTQKKWLVRHEDI